MWKNFWATSLSCMIISVQCNHARAETVWGEVARSQTATQAQSYAVAQVDLKKFLKAVEFYLGVADDKLDDAAKAAEDAARYAQQVARASRGSTPEINELLEAIQVKNARINKAKKESESALAGLFGEESDSFALAAPSPSRSTEDSSGMFDSDDFRNPLHESELPDTDRLGTNPNFSATDLGGDGNDLQSTDKIPPMDWDSFDGLDLSEIFPPKGRWK